MSIKIYDAAQSPNARKVRLLAAELGIPLERVPVSIQKGENRTPEYLAKNPNGKIPTLEEEGFVLWESGAIMKYLAAKRPEKSLMPIDAKGLLLLDQWLLWWTAHPEPALMSLAVEKVIKPFLGMPGNDQGIIRDAENSISRYLPVLERQLDGKEHVLGRLSILDFVIAPDLEFAGRVGVELGRYPNLTRLVQQMQSRPYWKDA